VHVRDLRVPIWLPVPSISLWGLTVLAGCVLCCVPASVLEKHAGQPIPIPPYRMGLSLISMAWILLWSGSFVLCDVRVPNDGVRVTIRSY
jgi:hypothetical protein